MMRFINTGLKGAYILELEKHTDERGYFARTFCAREFEPHKLPSAFVQCSTSFNSRRGTLRGLHYQSPPDTEAKLVRCTRGAVYDVIVDLRADSLRYGKHFAIELSAQNGLSLYIPGGCAHGFQTLEDNTDVFYQMTNFYEPGSASGLRYDDPDLDIAWPLPVTVISKKDLLWPRIANWESPFRVMND